MLSEILEDHYLPQEPDVINDVIDLGAKMVRAGASNTWSTYAFAALTTSLVYWRGKKDKLGRNRWQGLPDEFRFLLSFDIDPDTGCWVWQRSLSTPGYGKLHQSNGKQHGAHRFAWELFQGEIPEDKYVLHKCNVKACVNPDHLELGTQSKNIRDAVRDGLTRLGDDSHSSVLKEDQVKLIRMAVESGVPQKVCADVYGVSPMTINAIVHKRTWKHIL